MTSRPENYNLFKKNPSIVELVDSFLRSLVSLDLRSLAVFRAVLGIIVAIDTIQKSRFAGFFFTDQGVLPRSVLIESFADIFGYSFHLSNGRIEFIYLCLAIQLIATIAMIIGWRTTTATFTTWLMVCSLQARNNLILSGADDLMRLMLFWSIFLPTGVRFSLDSRNFEPPTKIDQRDLANFAFIFQLFCMYLVTAVLKSDPEWWSEFSAVAFTMRIESFVTHFGRWLGHFKSLMRLATIYTILVEFFFPLLCMFGQRARVFGIFLVISMHVGIALAMNVGLFPYLSIAYCIALIPNFIWQTRVLSFLEFHLDKFICSTNKTAAPASEFRSLNYVILIMALAGVCFQNAHNLNKSYVIPDYARAVIGTLSLYQGWMMFAPRPEVEDGWFVADGKFTDGSELDLLTRQAVSYEKPELISDSFENTQWRRLLWRLRFDGARVQLQFARALCRQYSSSSGSTRLLKSLDLFFMRYKIDRVGDQNSFSHIPIDKLHVWSHNCLAR